MKVFPFERFSVNENLKIESTKSLKVKSRWIHTSSLVHTATDHDLLPSVPGCNAVFETTGQLYAHRKKHERREVELAYSKIRFAQSNCAMYSSLGDLPAFDVSSPKEVAS